ncbi:MAG: PAS domain-containing protein [Vicinamibacterales bacterium]|nr:PAS domain-containing protein [Vicinamibacterales bacterium]
MTPATATPSAAPRPSAPVPARPADADHLRRVVEKQPACLFRVGVDGLILAANDAGLGLLGANQPAQILGGLLTTWIMPAHHAAWRDFARAVTSGTSQSMECELTDVSGTQRNVDFHGVPLVDHADGIPSLILGARDTTAQRSLEAALFDAEQRQPTDASSEKLHMLESKIKEVEADRQRIEQSLAKLPQLEMLLKQGRTHLQDLRTRLVEATQERDRLAAQLGGREVENERLWAEQVQLQQSLTEQQQRDLTALRAELQEAVAARDAAAARLTERETEHEQLRIARDEAIAERQGLAAQLVEREAEHEHLRIARDEAIAERDRLATQLSEQSEQLSERDRSMASLEERSRQEADERAQALGALRSDAEQATAERDRLSSELNILRAEHEEHVRASDAHRQQLSLEHDVARAGFEEAVRSASSQKREAEKVLADLRLELQSMDLAVRSIEPFAAAGRLAVALVRELLTAVADIDARAACLVAECPVDSSSREEIEQLRSDSVRASSLARQILHASEISHSEERS